MYGKKKDDGADNNKDGKKMILWFIISIAVIIILAVTLIRYHIQLNAISKQLEDTAKGSNLRAFTDVRNRCFKRLCRAVNKRLDSESSLLKASEKSQRELKYTISAVSHDIRTPLTGAQGYIQVLSSIEKDAVKQGYIQIISRRLDDLEQLLDELFLYTKLCNEAYTILCEKREIYPLLCESLAGFFYQFEKAETEPHISFEDEAICFEVSEEGVLRVFRNLISNALVHGSGDLKIVQKGREITFINHITENMLSAENLFERFYRNDTARHKKGAGLGLPIVRELMEKMGGKAWAEIKDGEIKIALRFES